MWRMRERGRQHHGGRSSFLGNSLALVIFSAHGQVDEGEDIKLYHYGEAQEDGIEDQHVDAQLPVQAPFVEVDAKDLGGDGGMKRARLGGLRDPKALFFLYRTITLWSPELSIKCGQDSGPTDTRL